MNRKPLINVIVPIYNTCDYISRCFESIKKQTYNANGIVLVDDGSEDGSSELIDELCGFFNNVIVIHQKNKGALLSRLNGVKISCCDFVTFLDSDDYIEPNMYEKLVNNALAYNADISHCGVKRIYGNDVSLLYGTNRKVIQNRIIGIRDLLSGKFIEPNLNNKIYKIELFNNINIDTRVNSNEDLLLNLYLFMNSNKSIYEDFTGYHYIYRDTSYCHSTNFLEQEKDDDIVISMIRELTNDDDCIRKYGEDREAVHLFNKYHRLVKNNLNDVNVIESIKNCKPHTIKTKTQKIMITKFARIYNQIYKTIR